MYRRAGAVAAGLALTTIGAAATGAFAGGTTPAGIDIAAAKVSTVTAAVAAERSCLRQYDAGTAGVVQRSFTMPRSGSLTVRLGSPSTHGDWDLALFDQATGRRLKASQAFRANEVVQAYAFAGRKLTIQACREAGSSAGVRLSTQVVAVPLTRITRTSQIPTGSVVRVSLPKGAASLKLLEGSGLDLGEDAMNGHVSVILHSAAQRRVLESLGLAYSTVVSDLTAQDRKDRAEDRAYTRRVGANGSPLPTGRTTYRDYDEVQSELKKLAADNPDLVKPFTLPKQTFQGRDTQGIEVDFQPGVENGRPVFGLVAMHHAREWPSVEAAMEFANDLIKGYRAKDPRVTRIMKKTRILIVPIVNGDGYISSRGAPIDPDPDGTSPVPFNTAQGVAPPGGLLSYRRKNCDGLIPSGAVPCELQWGIDPNRNYGQNWGGPGASTSPLDQDYRGTGPWSEPETQAIHEWSRKLNMTTFITMHNVAALVLRPPGVSTQGQAPDEKRLKLLGDAMGRATGYTSEYGYELYDTSGTTEDWNYGDAGTFGYTIEMGPAGGQFHQNYQEGVIDQYVGSGKLKGRGLREAYLLAAENSFNTIDHSVIKGRAPAGRTLRVHKVFKTTTGEICTAANSIVGNATGAEQGCFAPMGSMEIDDFTDYTMTVPRGGRFTWVLPPSTRPFVGKSGKVETYTLTCENNGAVVSTKEVTVARGQAVTASFTKC